MKINGFEITHDGKQTVTVLKGGVQPELFEQEVAAARVLLSRFHTSRPGSVWGCDGIGYGIQQQRGVVRICKSGVGPVIFKHGLAKEGYE